MTDAVYFVASDVADWAAVPPDDEELKVASELTDRAAYRLGVLAQHLSESTFVGDTLRLVPPDGFCGGLTDVGASTRWWSR